MKDEMIHLDGTGLKQVQLAAVREILRATTAALPLQDILPLIANVTIIAFDALTAWLMLLENDEHLHTMVVRGKDADQLVDTITTLTTGVIGRIDPDYQPMIVSPQRIDPNDPLLGFLADQFEPVVLVPIQAAGQIRGLLGAVVTVESTRDISFLVTLAEQAAIAIEDARLRSEAQTWRQRLDAVVMQMHDPVMVYDQQGDLIMLNDRAEQWLYGRDIQIGDSLAEVVRKADLRHADGSPLEWADMASAQALQGTVVDNLDLQITVLPEQSIRYMLANAVPLRTDDSIDGAVVVWHDITARKQMENALLGLLDREHAAIERLSWLQAVTEALARALTPQQVVDAIIEKGLRALGAQAGIINWLLDDKYTLKIIGYFGYEKDIIDEWRLFPIDTPAPAAEVISTQKAIWLDSGVEVVGRYPILSPINDRMHIGAFVALPLLGNQSSLGSLGVQFAQPRHFDAQDRAFLASLADLCAQALERAELYAAEQQARTDAQEALRLRDAFLSVASHELKTPLTVVLGQAQLLQNRSLREGTLNQRDQRALDAIIEQASQLNTLITAMLDVSHIERSQLAIIRTLVDLAALTQRLIANIQPTLDRHTLVYHIPDAPILVSGDAMRLEQIINNLLNNAIKYSPHGGVVTVDMQQCEAMVCVAISDEGIGIPADAVPNLFQRFYRADNAIGYCIRGTGIGLYVVKELVTLHGGTISVESREGEGSTFTVCLPLVIDDGR